MASPRKRPALLSTHALAVEAYREAAHEIEAAQKSGSTAVDLGGKLAVRGLERVKERTKPAGH